MSAAAGTASPVAGRASPLEVRRVFLLFGYGVTVFGNVADSAWLHGVKIVAVAVVAQAVWGMARNLCPDRERATIAVGAGMVALAIPSAPGQISTIAAGGPIGWGLLRAGPQPQLQHSLAVHLPRIWSVIALVSFLALLQGVPVAQAAQTVFVEELTWTELRDQIRAGKTTVIVPIGGTEQNGSHMALGKHNFRVRYLSEKIARALGNALVAPVIAYVPEGALSPPIGHMRFPGTITVPEEAFDKILEYAARSFKLAGFHDIVFLGDHGSYQKNEKAVADRLNKEWAAQPVRVHGVQEYYRASESEFGRLLTSKGFREEEVGTHAGLADTSLTLAVDPHLVRADRLQPGDGANGDPRRSSAELGQLGIDLIVTRTVDAIRKATSHP